MTVQNGGRRPCRIVHQPGRRRHRQRHRQRGPRRQRRHRALHLPAQRRRHHGLHHDHQRHHGRRSAGTRRPSANGTHTLGLTVTDATSAAASATRARDGAERPPPPRPDGIVHEPRRRRHRQRHRQRGPRRQRRHRALHLRLTVDGATVFTTTTSATTAAVQLEHDDRRPTAPTRSASPSPTRPAARQRHPRCHGLEHVHDLAGHADDADAGLNGERDRVGQHLGRRRHRRQ